MVGADSAPDEAVAWLRDARDDLRLAEHVLNHADLPARDACWHAHQAAEKALKAALTLDGADRTRTHALALLWSRLADGWPADPPLDAIAGLAPWGLRGRYLDAGPTASPGDAALAVAHARDVVGYVEAGFGERGAAG